MAVRTTDSAVQAILGDNYNNTTGLTSFITTASALTDWLVTKDDDSELGTTLLERIECHLAAHFYGHADQLLQSKSTGAASGQFQGATAMFLSSTLYGQTAMLLDVTSNLAKRSKEVEEGTKHVARSFWLGKQPDNQLDADERA